MTDRIYWIGCPHTHQLYSKNLTPGELIYAHSMVADEIALENKGRQLKGTYKSHESRKDGCVHLDTTKDNIRDRSTNTREQVAKMSGVGTVARYNKVMNLNDKMLNI